MWLQAIVSIKSQEKMSRKVEIKNYAHVSIFCADKNVGNKYSKNF